MSNRSKYLTRFTLTETGEVVGEGELTQARARAIVKAYRLAGLDVQAVA